MKFIPLTQGMTCIVDDDDFVELDKHKWYATKSSYNFYARRTAKGKQIYMHRQIMNVTDGDQVHHGRYGTLCNMKSNLSVCSRSENLSYRRYGQGA